MKRCLYCQKPLVEENIISLLLSEDKLCLNCRKEMKGKLRKNKYLDYKLISFYQYDDESLFKSMLIQYKEAFDEALYPIFLKPYENYLNLLYHDYYLVLIPSTIEKERKRGFNHLNLITSNLKLKRKTIGMKEELSQRGKNDKEREKMIDNYYPISKFKSSDKILLFDDVLTTGSSLQGAIKCLKPLVKEIVIVTLSLKNQ